MRVSGEFRPPIIGHSVEPYPLSGSGAIELAAEQLRIEGSRGLPWEVQVLGTLGFFVGCVLMYLIATMKGEVSRATSLAGFGALLACIAASCTAGYALSRRRDRPRRSADIAYSSIVDVAERQGRVELTVTFRKRWQNRKQLLHFRPANAADAAPLASAIRDRLSGHSPDA